MLQTLGMFFFCNLLWAGPKAYRSRWVMCKHLQSLESPGIARNRPESPGIARNFFEGLQVGFSLGSPGIARNRPGSPGIARRFLGVWGRGLRNCAGNVRECQRMSENIRKTWPKLFFLEISKNENDVKCYATNHKLLCFITKCHM